MRQQQKQHANTSVSCAGGSGKLKSQNAKRKSSGTKTLKLIHDLSNSGLKFQQYSEFIDKADIFLRWAEIQQLCAKCAALCMNIRNSVIDEHDGKD